MRIGDIVSTAPDATFANDVKLDAYADPEQNLRLARSYKFTHKVPAIEGRALVSSVGIVEKLERSLVNHLENRHTVIATFGHGKSHLALALANFFGKPADSPEATALLAHMQHVAGDTVAAGFRDFKQHRLPFLVVRLRGDVGQGLAQQFLQGLQAALGELPATQEERLPFWFAAAAKFLSGLSEEQQARANACLQSCSLNIADLLERVRGHQPEYHDLCVQVHQELFGTRPDFGGEVSLQYAVNWAVQTFCDGSAAKAGGLLVLFDEFSAFIEDYASRRQAGGALALQNLLNGISDCKGKALFVAFCQHDPDATADNTFRFAGSDEQLQSLHKELTRLPQTHRYPLYSSMETVLDGYLAQNEDAWKEFEGQVFPRLEDASDTARTLLKPRYEDTAGWRDGKFEEIVTKGCFPLHPLTAGLFCHLEFKNSARRVLLFALDALEKIQDEEAAVGGRPNWVYPVALVDFFERHFAAENEYAEYELACRQAGTEAPALQKAILKAILLYHVGELKRGSRMHFDQAAAELCGHPADRCRAALSDLEEMGVIYRHPTDGTYHFERGGRRGQLKNWLAERRKRKSLDWQTMEDIKNRSGDIKPERYEIEQLSLGHSDEWAVSETFLPAALFTAENVRKIVYPFEAKQSGILAGKRGGLIRLIARDETEIASLEESAERILDEALGSAYPLPVVVALPMHARPHLVNALLDLHTLTAEATQASQEYGQEAVANTLTLTRNAISDEINKLRGWATYIVPQPYRATVAAQHESDNVKSFLKWCYWQAYGIPNANFRRFFTNRKSDAPTLRNAVGYVAMQLLADNLNDQAALMQQPENIRSIVTDLISAFLRPTAWGVVDATDHVCEPSSRMIKAAWNHLDTKFAAGGAPVSVRSVLMPLLNPPFGLDYNQVVLLFCAWYGYRRRDLDITEKYMGGMTPARIENFSSQFSRPKEFLDKLCIVAEARIARRDPGKEEEAVRALLAKARAHSYAVSEAQADIARLRHYAEDPRSDSRLKEDAQSCIKRLEADIERANRFREEYQAIQAGLKNASVGLSDLRSLRKKAEELPDLGRVKDDFPEPQQILSQIDQRIEAKVRELSGKYEKLADIRQFSEHQNQLKSLRKTVESLGKPALLETVEQALQKLAAAAKNLEEKQKDAEALAVVNSIKTRDIYVNVCASLQLLEGLTAHTGEAKRRIEKCKAELLERIADEKKAVREREAKAETTASAKDARALHDTVLGELGGFRGAPEGERLQAVVARCKALIQFFDAVEKIEREPLATPQQVSERLAALERFSQQEAGSLNRIQTDRIAAARTVVEEAARQATEKAVAWLDAVDGEAGATTKPQQLLDSLENPPPFLPVECWSRVDTVRARVQQRLDENEILAIKERFRRIRDKARRQACLTALQELLEEGHE